MGIPPQLPLCMQLWKLQPWLQQQVNATLRELRGLRGPTVAFHVRGGDLLADLTNNVSCLSHLLRKHFSIYGFVS